MPALDNQKGTPLYKVLEFLANEGFTKVMTRNPPYVEMKHTVLGGMGASVHRANPGYSQDVPSSHVYRKADATVELYFSWDMNMDNERLLRLTCSDNEMEGRLKAFLGSNPGFR